MKKKGRKKNAKNSKFYYPEENFFKRKFYKNFFAFFQHRTSHIAIIVTQEKKYC